jgi:hypothetical protein
MKLRRLPRPNNAFSTSGRAPIHPQARNRDICNHHIPQACKSSAIHNFKLSRINLGLTPRASLDEVPSDLIHRAGDETARSHAKITKAANHEIRIPKKTQEDDWNPELNKSLNIVSPWHTTYFLGVVEKGRVSARERQIQ